MKKLVVISFLALNMGFSQTQAEIPFNKALGVYQGTKDEYKDISPFWGMVAIYGKLLERIRFFGPYTDKTNDKGEVIGDEGQDPIAKLIKELFPSPDGVQFVANTLGHNPVGDLSRNLSKINDLITVLIDSKIDAKTKENKVSAVFKSTAGKKTKDENIKKISNLLIEAYEKQEELANPNKHDQQLYPENIVIISLLSFFCKVADDKGAFKGLTLLMKNDFDQESSFDKKDYFEYRDKGNKELEKIVSNSGKNPELSFLMAKGYEVYENPFMSPIQYRGDTCFKSSEQFSDCGETSLRNILRMLLGEKGSVPMQSLKELESKIDLPKDVKLEDTAFQKIGEFFKTYPFLESSATKKAHDDWASIVSDLNKDEQEKNLGRVLYKKGKKSNETYEITSNSGASESEIRGILNMLNVIARLIPDKELNTAWSTESTKWYTGKEDIKDDENVEGQGEIAQKLTRLCFLLSREKHMVSWENQETKDQKITSPFVTITFSINDKPAYNWNFSKGHFQINPIESPKNDWRLEPDLQNIVFPNEWMGSLYLKFDAAKFIEADKYGATLPLNLVYNSGLRTVDGVVRTMKSIFYETIEHKTLTQFIPLIAHWITKSIPLNDNHALNEVSLPLYVVHGFEKVKDNVSEILGAPHFKPIKDIVKKLEKQKPDEIVTDLVEKGDNTLLIMMNKKGSITSLNLIRNKKITDAGIKSLTNLTSLNLSYNYKITDTGIKGLTNLTSLNLSYNYKITDTGIKGLTNLTSLNLGYNDKITDTGIKGLTNLTSLNLSYNYKITDAGIKGLTEITRLKLNKNDKITDAGLKDLINLTSLNLNINKKITDEGLKPLKKLTKLKLVSNEKITDKGLKYLPNLANLDLGGRSIIKDEGLEGLKNLTHLDLDSNRIITNEGLKDLRNLTHLGLHDNKRITDKGLQYLPNLTSLDLRGDSVITDEGLEKLPNPDKLTSLNLYGNKTITRKGVKSLKNLTTLTLNTNTTITDEDLEYLPNLTTLDLFFNETITGEGLKYLPNLTGLDLMGNEKITDKDLEQLPNLDKLTRLNLGHKSMITNDFLLKLRELNPNIEIVKG